ncbi:MAG: hypothetical protein ABFR19_05945 [Pseudomonadota bacterium]
MICFVVAYRAEAAALISHYGLQQSRQHAFPLYTADQMTLVICGSGKINAAAAVAYLHGATGFHRDAVWINIGIAGHASAVPGSACLAGKVIDKGSGRVLHLALPAAPPWESAAVTTYDQPHRGHEKQQGLFDMEASGFAFTARRFSQPRLVHCIKIVSDNRNTGIGIPDSGTLDRWMQPQMRLLDNFLHSLSLVEN